MVLRNRLEYRLEVKNLYYYILDFPTTASMPRTSQVTHCRFTFNNYTDEDEKKLQNYDCSYLVYGKEIAPTTGTPHLQGYMQFSKRRSFGAIHKEFPTMHVLKCDATDQDNYDYATKDNKAFEKGERREERSKQGKRTDIDKVKEHIKKGGSANEIAFETRSYQALKFAQSLESCVQPPWRKNIKVTWIWGDTGLGKTRKAYEILGEDACKLRSLQWFNGYNGETKVILDDVRIREKSDDYNTLLEILDIYPTRVPTKGGFVNWRATEIVVTSIYAPHSLPYVFEDIGQLVRRVTQVICLS